jgi:hypothetical protein
MNPIADVAVKKEDEKKNIRIYFVLYSFVSSAAQEYTSILVWSCAACGTRSSVTPCVRA